MTEPTYTSQNVAAELGISAARVRALAQSRGVGQRPQPPLRSAWLFTAADIDAMRDRPAGRPSKFAP